MKKLMMKIGNTISAIIRALMTVKSLIIISVICLICAIICFCVFLVAMYEVV